jgi:hypothetical protein
LFISRIAPFINDDPAGNVRCTRTEARLPTFFIASPSPPSIYRTNDLPSGANRVIHVMTERDTKETIMTTFTIDTDNNITAHGTPEKTAATTATPLDTLASQKELAELAAGWPAERLATISSSLLGVTPVKKLGVGEQHSRTRRSRFGGCACRMVSKMEPFRISECEYQRLTPYGRHSSCRLVIGDRRGEAVTHESAECTSGLESAIDP